MCGIVYMSTFRDGEREFSDTVRVRLAPAEVFMGIGGFQKKLRGLFSLSEFMFAYWIREHQVSMTMLFIVQ